MSKESKNAVVQAQAAYDLEHAKAARDIILAAQGKRAFYFLITIGSVSEIHTVYAADAYTANLHMIETYPNHRVSLLKKLELDNGSE